MVDQAPGADEVLGAVRIDRPAEEELVTDSVVVPQEVGAAPSGPSAAGSLNGDCRRLTMFVSLMCRRDCHVF